MNPVIDALRKHIPNRDARFVFPSAVAADLWARKTCALGLARSVASARFLAWDRFKEGLIRESGSPAAAVTRKLFAEALIRKNAETGCLKAVVPPEYKREGKIFVPFIARILPSLAYREKLTKSPGPEQAAARDAEDEDFDFIKKEYAAFLERHGLFEPSWEEVSLREDNALYVLFFPELIEDFAEYDALLRGPRFIRVNAEAVPAAGVLYHYRSAREEIRSAVTEIEKLHEEGIPYEDMALSVPGLEEMEPYIVKEFYLRQIPVSLRAGKILGETGAGRLFSLVNECVNAGFSFNSLKTLLLNDHIPWKEREKNRALIRYGIKYNCVSGYVQNRKTVDIWEEAFKEIHDGGELELRRYYREELKPLVQALVRSKNFSAIRDHYFAFRGRLLSMENISGADNAVLARCVEELSSLIDLEEQFNDPSLIPSSPYAFFLSCLEEQEYVRANPGPGVNIYRWRVAAAAPFACHYVLNASQSAASVLYQPLKFLRPDKRRALGLEDRDASAAFFTLCDTGEEACYKSRTRISSSAQTFSGWSIPHSFFAGGKTIDPPPTPADPYIEERRFWKEAGGALKKIYPAQRQAFDLWKNALVLKENHFSFLKQPAGTLAGADAVKKLLTDAVSSGNTGTENPETEGRLNVTPTNDLNVYYDCAVKWLYRRIFQAEEFSLEAALLDDTSLGLLYHRILQNLFERIKIKDKAFDSSHLDTYKHWVPEITKAAIERHPAFKGPLAVPLVSPQAAGMAKKISFLLDLEAKNFNQYNVFELEFPVSVKTGELFINGIIDRISVSPKGEPVIVDYKTSYLPEQTDDPEEAGLKEFQMPLYIMLYEEKIKTDTGPALVKGAYFYSINGRKMKTAMGDGRSVPDRGGYEPYLKAAKNQIGEFAEKVKALDFTPRVNRIGDCAACMYKTICRTAYFLNAFDRKGE
jgi:hypothetical protein